jgi:steroid delta-isomerase-like uncharacterized protein
MAIAERQLATQTQNAKSFRAAIETANRRDNEGLNKFLADEVTFINPMVGTTDKAGFRKFHADLWAGLPDIHYQLERTVSEGDTVVGECTVTGTHRGELAGVPASNKPVSVPATFIVDYKDGKATRWSAYLDVATVLRQIGAMK